MFYDILKECTEFEWDDGNATKNWEKHAVTRAECEQIFFNKPLVVTFDAKHSDQEQRYFALGRTNSGRNLFVVFTIRAAAIRVISARNMNKKEVKIYEQ